MDNRSEWDESSSNIYDFSGEGNNGTPISFDGDELTTGVFGNAFDFAGSDDMINLTNDNSINLNGKNFTIMFWLNSHDDWDTVSSRRSPICKGSDSVQQFAIFLEDADDQLKIETWDGAWRDAPTSTTEWDANVWYHFAVTFNQSDVIWYIDGQEDSVTSFPYTFRDTEANVTVGWFHQDSWSFNGTLDEIAIWNRTLTAAEILDLYRLGEDTYYWSANATDGNLTGSEGTHEFKVDQTYPTIDFVSNTPDNNTNRSQDWVNVNVSITETNNHSAFVDWNPHMEMTVFSQNC
jgi:hypothetical protein